MKRYIPIPLALLAVLLLAAFVHGHSFDLNRQQVTTLESIIEDLNRVRAVFIGESHDVKAHHAAQLQLLQELQDAGIELGIGLEMFRQDGQPDLDRWVRGDLDEAEFARIFEQHWSNWSMYREIFLYAREQGIPLLGLNISREIINQVARNGFNSLNNEQREKLPLAVCDVSPAYREFIKRALGSHGDHGSAFENFCEAQMLWDASMAANLQSYLNDQPLQTVVVLAGNGHSWKHGIPEQLQRRGEYSTRVLLPEVPGHIDLTTITAEDADYLLQGVGVTPLH